MLRCHRTGPWHCPRWMHQESQHPSPRPTPCAAGQATQRVEVGESWSERATAPTATSTHLAARRDVGKSAVGLGVLQHDAVQLCAAKSARECLVQLLQLAGLPPAGPAGVMPAGDVAQHTKWQPSILVLPICLSACLCKLIPPSAPGTYSWLPFARLGSVYVKPSPRSTEAATSRIDVSISSRTASALLSTTSRHACGRLSSASVLRRVGSGIEAAAVLRPSCRLLAAATHFCTSGSALTRCPNRLTLSRISCSGEKRPAGSANRDELICSTWRPLRPLI
jgi:hypothetical protein